MSLLNYIHLVVFTGCKHLVFDVVLYRTLTYEIFIMALLRRAIGGAHARLLL